MNILSLQKYLSYKHNFTELWMSFLQKNEKGLPTFMDQAMTAKFDPRA